ncbi:MAG: 30S ribosome-binding factor RbfA [Anaerolineae bacterium]|jgi:ribosome-binding factor A
MPTRRQRQVAELVHRELSLLLLHEVRDPRLADVTITGLEVTPDLLIARVYFTVLGDQDEKQAALQALEHARGFLRTELAARVELRFVPDLEFRPDESWAYAQRIEELLDEIRETDLSEDDQETG